MKELKKFKNNLIKYQKISNKVYSVKNRNSRISDEEYKKLKNKEENMRSKLTEDYGTLQNIIDELIGWHPYMTIPAFPSQKWDVFEEALSSRFNTSKSDCLKMAIQQVTKAVGRSKSGKNIRKISTSIFSEQCIKKIDDKKIRTLCLELNNIYPENPNSSALIFRTILLLTLQKNLVR